MHKPKKLGRIIFLDWLRIFAFTSVLIGHKFYTDVFTLSNDNSVHASLRLILKISLHFFAGGGAGVVVFFLVSGYIIIHVLQNEQPFEFFIKRLFRIYPLYLSAVLLHYFFLIFIDHSIIEPRILVSQLLLIGDFFNTPHALGGVEWTLRIEILFYTFMFTLKYFNILNHKHFLPYVFICAVLCCGYIYPFPNNLPTVGYVNCYAPFLFLGAFIWLYENQYVSIVFTGVFTGFVFLQHWHLISTIQPNWNHCHFSSLAFLLFLGAFYLRNKIITNRFVWFCSELTYAVYLLHNWLFEYIRSFTFSGNILQNRFYALIVLLIISVVLMKTVEKPGITLGQKLLSYFRKDSTLHQVTVTPTQRVSL